MGYFNYFIKCVIRNLTYRLCKPKVFLIVLLSVLIILLLHNTGYCAEWTDGEIEAVLDGFSTITSNQGTIISQLSSMGINVNDIENKLNTINTTLNNIKTDTNLTVEKLTDLLNEVESLNTTLTQLAQQQNIYYNNVTLELQQLRDAIVGSEATPVTFEDLGVVPLNINGTVLNGFRKIRIPMQYGYTYKITVTYTNPSSGNMTIQYKQSELNLVNTSQSIGTYLDVAGTIPANTTSSVRITTRDYQKQYLYLGWSARITDIKVTSSIEGLVDVIDRTNQEINSGIQQGNQLQQESNQLQQEQNDFLKQEQSDSDVSVDSFNSVDSNDITSDGLTGVFTNIYNSITSWSSKDINLPIPYTNKSIVIPANYTHNMLSSFGGSWIISFISSIYYFIVARFIIYSITSIINSIKSGSILETDSKNNITTDML